jgi:hypothetical protein
MLMRWEDRRYFTRTKPCLLKEVTLLCDLERGRLVAKLVKSKLPHTIPIPHQERVLLFKKKVNTQKTALIILEPDSASPTVHSCQCPK